MFRLQKSHKTAPKSHQNNEFQQKQEKVFLKRTKSSQLPVTCRREPNPINMQLRRSECV
jgi:hypothetical protein